MVKDWKGYEEYSAKLSQWSSEFGDVVLSPVGGGEGGPGVGGRIGYATLQDSNACIYSMAHHTAVHPCQSSFAGKCSECDGSEIGGNTVKLSWGVLLEIWACCNSSNNSNSTISESRI